MTPEQFTYWLQGWFELNKTIDHREGATPETLKMIEDHLKTVFTKVTPDTSKFPANGYRFPTEQIKDTWSLDYPHFPRPTVVC